MWPTPAIRSRRYAIYHQGRLPLPIALAWPADGKLLIKSLATGSPHYGGEIARGGLLGSEPNLVWSRNADRVAISGTQNVLGSYWFLRDGSPVLAAGNLTAAFLPWQELSG